MAKRKDISRQMFGKWVALAATGEIDPSTKSAVWQCRNIETGLLRELSVTALRLHERARRYAASRTHQGLQIKIPKTLHARLKREAESHGLSLNAYVNKILEARGRRHEGN
jgi:predicted HicB family RNase H-like nuclease